MAAPIPAPNWIDEVTITYNMYTVTPNVGCTKTIARHTGKWQTRFIWIEWATMAFVQAKVAELVSGGWQVDGVPAPAKPREELDIANITLTARKRTAS